MEEVCVLIHTVDKKLKIASHVELVEIPASKFYRCSEEEFCELVKEAAKEFYRRLSSRQVRKNKGLEVTINKKGG